jgi:hypothetical protein
VLKQEITYKDFDGNPQTEMLYFNLSKTEMVDLLDLQPRLEKWLKITQGEQRNLTTAEVQDLLGIIKLLIEKSYGERSDDGKRFRKSPEIFADFKDSAVYDAFLFGLFEDIQLGLSFMVGILPQDLVDNESLQQAQQAFEQSQQPRVQEVPIPNNVATVGGELSTVKTEVPAWIRENRDPTQKELANMSREELAEAFRRKNQ